MNERGTAGGRPRSRMTEVMTSTALRSRLHRWIRRGFIVWAVVSTSWLLNSFRTQGVAAALLSSDGRVTVERSGETLTFRPTSAVRRSGLVFIVGGGVSAEAYAPLLRPLTDDGHPTIEGANHSQLGHYGDQLFDGTPTVSRERQQDETRAVLRRVLAAAEPDIRP